MRCVAWGFAFAVVVVCACSKSSETGLTSPAASTVAAATGIAEGGGSDAVAAPADEAGSGVMDASSAASAAEPTAPGSGSRQRSLTELAHSTTSANWQIARNVLEPKVAEGRASRDEILLLLEICKNQRDGLCQKECKRKLKTLGRP
jgi:hypothetical protein